MHVDIDISAMEKIPKELRESGVFGERVVVRLAAIVSERMREKAPKGRRLVPPRSTRRKTLLGLRESVGVLKHVQPGSGFGAVARVGATARHARYVIEGTRPHVIEHRRAKALAIPSRLSSDGRPWRFAKRVFHPGSQPNDFHRKTADTVGEAEITRAAKAAAISLGFGDEVT